ncbi:MAG TPA: twin-arginine translocase subunit TatC [Frankiaceae bacterium]|jgi:sec-independent protein translocase protein TatC|nr:twin-arginine translocase subunit TatC [Frankiaceae bacterium]
MTDTADPDTAGPAASRRAASPDDSRMTLVEHLSELRSRMVKSLLAIAVCSIVAYVLWEPIFEFLKEPYCALPADRRFNGDQGCDLAALGVLDQFLTRMKVALMVGVLGSAPIWLYQLWAFVTPGLHPRERRWAVPFVTASLVLFGCGATFSYLTLDKGLSFLLSIGGSGVVTVLTIDRYLSFVTLMLLAFGVSFEFPVLMIFLNIIGVTPTARLRQWRRGMYFGLSVFAAVITPSQDPFTFLAMWLPMCLFYEVSILFGRVRDKARGRRSPESTDQWADDETSPL